MVGLDCYGFTLAISSNGEMSDDSVDDVEDELDLIEGSTPKFAYCRQTGHFIADLMAQKDP